MDRLDKAEATDRFYEYVWPHRAVVLRAALIQTGNAADGDDLAQETLLKAFRAIATFDPQTNANAKAWLLTILQAQRAHQDRSAEPPPGRLAT